MGLVDERTMKRTRRWFLKAAAGVMATSFVPAPVSALSPRYTANCRYPFDPRQRCRKPNAHIIHQSMLENGGLLNAHQANMFIKRLIAKPTILWDIRYLDEIKM